MIRVTVWNEFKHELEMEKVKELYPDGIHEFIAGFLRINEDMQVRTAWLDQPENGLTDEVLENTDVLVWWGHCAHNLVLDSVVEKVKTRVLQGMGFIALHSAHHSKPMMSLLGTTLNLRWRDGDKERIWCCNPSHPIAEGLPDYFELEVEEMYGEFFDIPTPDDVVFIGWFSGGEVFRSGCTFTRGRGKIFYFQPGHEDNPTYYKPEIQKVITNAIRWARPINPISGELKCIGNPVPPEKIKKA